MPETADAATLERRVAALLEQHRDALEQLVDAELDRALDLIVVERLAARNGARASTELCARCGERPRAPGKGASRPPL